MSAANWITIAASLVVIVAGLSSVKSSKESMLHSARSFRSSAQVYRSMGREADAARCQSPAMSPSERRAWPLKPKVDLP